MFHVTANAGPHISGPDGSPWRPDTYNIISMRWGFFFGKGTKLQDTVFFSTNDTILINL